MGLTPALRVGGRRGPERNQSADDQTPFQNEDGTRTLLCIEPVRE